MSVEPANGSRSVRVGGQALTWCGAALLGIGVLCLLAGLYGLAQPHRPVTCDGEKMQPGDTCVSPRESRSFQELKDERDHGPRRQFTFAVPALVLGALCWGAGRKVTSGLADREFRRDHGG